jgi:hypothetical protein
LLKIFDLYDHAPLVEGNLGCIKEFEEVYGYPVRLYVIKQGLNVAV